MAAALAAREGELAGQAEGEVAHGAETARRGRSAERTGDQLQREHALTIALYCRRMGPRGHRGVVREDHHRRPARARRGPELDRPPWRPVNQTGRSFVNTVESKSGRPGLVDDLPGHEALVDAHRGRLLRLCQLLLRDREEAGDVVQEVFIQAYEAQTQARSPGDWAAWLTRVAVNACHDRHRAGWWMRFRRSSAPIEEIPLAAGDSSPADRVLGEETRRRLWLAFRKLPDRQREVFVLRYIDDLSTAEVAAALALSPGSVKRHLFRAIRRLRQSLRGES